MCSRTAEPEVNDLRLLLKSLRIAKPAVARAAASAVIAAPRAETSAETLATTSSIAATMLVLTVVVRSTKPPILPLT